MKKRKNITVEEALEKVSASARRKAFRDNLPVAVVEDGKSVLIYRDGTRRAVTQQILREFSNGEA